VSRRKCIVVESRESRVFPFFSFFPFFFPVVCILIGTLINPGGTTGELEGVDWREEEQQGVQTKSQNVTPRLMNGAAYNRYRGIFPAGGGAVVGCANCPPISQKLRQRV
jgi:hypothetical protein